MRRRIFLSLVERGGVRDTLAALLGRERINEQMSRTDEIWFHGGSRLDGQQFIHQRRIDAAAKLNQGFGQDKVSL